MAQVVITITDREGNEGFDFSMEITPPPNPNVPPTVAEALAFDITRRLREMERDCWDADNVDDPTDMWEPNA